MLMLGYLIKMVKLSKNIIKISYNKIFLFFNLLFNPTLANALVKLNL